MPIIGACSPTQIVDSVVPDVVIKMQTHRVRGWARTYKRFQYQQMHPVAFRHTIASQGDVDIALPITSRPTRAKHPLCHVTKHPPKRGHTVLTLITPDQKPFLAIQRVRYQP